MQKIEKRPSLPDFKAIEHFASDEIDFIVPGYDKSSQYMVAMHSEFYHWLQDWVQGKVVLDAGSGEGFGAAILAETATRVIGIDIRPELVEHARHRYPKENLAFEVMNCEAMSFSPASFEVVVCDELVEHLPHYKAFMADAFRILKPGGLFICATTNAQLTFKKPDGSPMNPQHFQEFTPDEFEKELRQYYVEIKLFGERMKGHSEAYILNKRARTIERVLLTLNIKSKIPIKWRNFVRGYITGVNADDLVTEGFEIVEDGADNSLYVIGCAVKPY